MDPVQEAREKVEQLKQKKRAIEQERARPGRELREAENELANLTASFYVVIACEDYNQDYSVVVQGVSNEVGTIHAGLRLRLTREQQVCIRSTTLTSHRDFSCEFYLIPGDVMRFTTECEDLRMKYKVVVCHTFEAANSAKEELLLEDSYRNYRNGIAPGVEPPS